MAQKVTVLIPTFNSLEYLPTLIHETRWADEVLVVDSYSTDGTVEYCHENNIRLLQNKYINSARQKNWAIPQCTNEWVFILDTDERLPTALQNEIRQKLDAVIPSDVDAFQVARRTYFLNSWIKTMGLWPDHQTRLFRRSVGRYEDKEVHADVVVPGKVLLLENPLDHFATPSLSKQIGLLDRYSTYQADELQKRGKRFSYPSLIIRPTAAFLVMYLVRGGIRSGVRGLFISFHTMAFVFFCYMKLWEKEWRAKQPPAS